jgi:L-ascorbate metabolism protein UlaG (beta-lactamase superfamily)
MPPATTNREDDAMIRALTGTLLTLALAATATPASADDRIATDIVKTNGGDLVIRPFHHASLLLIWNGVAILVDPAPPVSGPKPADITAEYKAVATPDLILITHEHGDHFNVQILEAVVGADTVLVTCQDVADKMPADLKAKTKVMAAGDSATVKDVPIAAVAAYNTTAERAKFHPPGCGIGYVLTLGGKRIYIAGDTEETPEMKALTDIDVAFLPMNLPYTMDIEHAAQAVKDFKPKVVYPYHYSGSDVEAFKAQVGDAAEVRLLKWY